MTDQLPADITEAIDKVSKFAGLYGAVNAADKPTFGKLYDNARAALDAVILKHLRATDLGRSALAEEGGG